MYIKKKNYAPKERWEKRVWAGWDVNERPSAPGSLRLQMQLPPCPLLSPGKGAGPSCRQFWRRMPGCPDAGPPLPRARCCPCLFVPLKCCQSEQGACQQTHIPGPEMKKKWNEV